MQAAHTHENHEHDHAHGFDARAWLKTAVLLGLAAYFAYNIATGNLTNYINVRFAWLSYLAVGLYFLLGVASGWDALRASRSHDHHDHHHASLSWGALALVALPLVLGTLIPSRPLGADAVEGNLSLSAANSTSITTLTINPLDRNVLDWLRVINSVDDYSELNGQPADVIGFVYREPGFSDDQFMLARFTMSCCVADASAIGVPVTWDGAGTFAADSWVRVQGSFAVDTFRDAQVPVLQAASVEAVDQPEHPYLYP